MTRTTASEAIERAQKAIASRYFLARPFKGPVEAVAMYRDNGDGTVTVWAWTLGEPVLDAIERSRTMPKGEARDDYGVRLHLKDWAPKRDVEDVAQAARCCEYLAGAVR